MILRKKNIPDILLLGNVTLSISLGTNIFSCCPLVSKVESKSFVTSWTMAGQAPLFMEFSGKEHWSRKSIPSPGIKPHLLHCRHILYQLSHQGSPISLVLSFLMGRLSPLSVQSSHSVLSDSLQPQGLHTRLPSPSPTPGACSNSCLSSQWCHLTISSFIIPLSPSPQFFPASGSFPMSQFFTSRGQSIGASASPSVLPVNI